MSFTTARKIFVWQTLFFAVLLSGVALVNGYSVHADRVRGGDPVPLWAPMVWEFSSNLLVWLLVPVLHVWLARFPLTRRTWSASVPAHVLATVPFSLVHTEGMIWLRELAYRIVGSTYDFGPFFENWVYEYRKDCLTYCVIVGALLAFRAHGLALDARAAGNPSADRQEPSPSLDPPHGGASLERLVVRKRNREFILDAANIDRIDADGNYVVLHAAGETYRLRESLDGLARRLGGERFVRVHRTHVVNIARIREIQPWDNGDYRILLKDGSFVNFSRRYRSRLSHLFR